MNQRRIIHRMMTPIFRVSFPDLFTPKAFENGPPKYSVTAIFKKNLVGDEAKKFKVMVAEAERALINLFGAEELERLRKLNKISWPIHDGEEREYEGYGPEVVFCRFSSKFAPTVEGRYKEALHDGDIYPGCYARATISCYAYNKINKGVAFGLGNVQKAGDGQPLGAGPSASDEFDEIPDSQWIDNTGNPDEPSKDYSDVPF